jgi:tRNA-2-methylthio-N6-dimethylallyladenosine synthase
MQAVHFNGPSELIGQIASVRIIGSSMNSLTGEFITAREVAA